MRSRANRAEFKKSQEQKKKQNNTIHTAIMLPIVLKSFHMKMKIMKIVDIFYIKFRLQTFRD